MTPFVVARPGLALADADGVRRVDPLRTASAPLVAAIARIEGGPRWVTFDCAALPGAIVGLAGDDDAPLAIVAATPLLAAGGWFLSRLTTVDARAAPEREVLDVALRVLAPARVVAAAPWGSAALAAYVARGPLRVRAAWLPGHSEPATCVFELAAGAEVADPPRAVNVARLPALQRAIERGARPLLVAPALLADERRR